VAKSTECGLRSLKRAEMVARMRGKTIESMIGRKRMELLAETLQSVIEAEQPEEPAEKPEDEGEKEETREGKKPSSPRQEAKTKQME
jgi:hypothetical protein